MTNKKEKQISVSSEITKLERLLIHSPGGEMNNMLPNKRDEWLIDDILDTKIIQDEYQQFAKILLLFLDPEKREKSINPSDPNFHKSEVVIDAQYKLAELFADINNEKKTLALIEHVVALERLHFKIKIDLIKLYEEAKHDYIEKKELERSKFMSLVKTLISGKLNYRWKRKSQNKNEWELQTFEDKPLFIMKPIPNFIFTRDIAVALNNHLLLTKPANEIRHREVVLMKYIAECFLFKGIDSSDFNEILEKVIEISEDCDYFQYDPKELEAKKVNFEGGDIMMVSEKHLLIGKSQRTSIEAINKLIHRIFKKNIGIEIISVIQIAEKRSQMHIDTILTQVREDVWMLYGRLSKKVIDEELEADNASFSHNDILKVKGDFNKLSKENEFVTVQQFYCKEGSYKIAEKPNRDFHIYDRDDLDEMYKDVLKKRELKVEELSVNDQVRRKEYSEKFTYDMLPKDLKYTKPRDLESLLREVSEIEFNVKSEVQFVYSGNREYPFDEREQWTDGCNLLSLGNGVVIGYDRNRKTSEEFERVMRKINRKPNNDSELDLCFRLKDVEAKLNSKNNHTESELENFKNKLNDLEIEARTLDELCAPASNKKLSDFITKEIEKKSKELDEEKKMLYSVTATDLLNYISGNTHIEIVEFTKGLKDLLITIPSGELSRARGGSHCMSMPLLREKYFKKNENT